VRRREPSYNLKEKIYNRDNYTCFYCGIRVVPGHPDWKFTPIEIDHVIPLSKGGENTEENLVCSCRKCNRSKGSKIIQRHAD